MRTHLFHPKQSLDHKTISSYVGFDTLASRSSLLPTVCDSGNMPLDPLSALSVAASVVQFLDFSSKIVSKGVQAYKSSDGALIDNAEIEEATQRLAQLSKTLETSMVPGQGGVLSDTDQQLATICKSCVSVSSELIIYLEKLKVPNGQQHRKLTSFRKALKSVWSAADLDRTVHRLDVLKGELETHVLVSLR